MELSKRSQNLADQGDHRRRFGSERPLVPVRPSLVWRGGLPGIPDCCFEHAHQTRLFRRPRRATPPARRTGEVRWRRSSSAPAALDVHKAQVTACVRVPDARGAARAARGGVRDDRARAARAARLAGRARRHAGGDGGHRRVLEAAVGDPRGRVRAACWSTPGTSSRSRAARPTSRTRVAVPARRGRAAEGQLRAAQADPPAAQPHALSQDADPGARARGQPAAQGARGRRHQARLRRRRTSWASPGATCSTRWSPARPTRTCSPSWRAGRCARRSPRCARRSRAASTPTTRCGSARSSRHIDFLDEQIDRLSDAIEEQIGPFAPAVELLCTIPGIQRRTAEVIIAEIGTDMSVFATARHLASWAGRCPGNDQSAGKRRSGKTRNGSKWLDFALEEAAMAAIRVKGQLPRRPIPAAQAAPRPQAARSAPSSTRC